MFRSLKTKLILGMTLLLLVAFGVTAVLLVNQKSAELGEDIYHSVRSFSDLTAPQIVDLYERYLAEESFVYFNRELQTIFTHTQEITGIGVASYSGVVLYDSSEEQTRQYEGEERIVPDDMLERIQATYPSYLLEDGRVVYVRTDVEGMTDFLDITEQPVEPITSEERIIDVIYPVGARYAVLYTPSYATLEARIQEMWVNISLLLVFALLVGLAFAYFFSSNITRPINRLRAGAEVIGRGDFSARVEVKTRDEVGVLASTFNKMAQDLETSIEAKLFKERVGKELEIAAGIQKQLLPKTIPVVLGLDIAAGIIPAAEVGGDVYDIFTVDNENFFGYVGDVTGHGVPAGLVVSIANALFLSYAPLKDPKEILVNVNRIIKAKTSTNMFVTLVLWHWNIKTQKLTLVSAGHEVALKYTAAQPAADGVVTGSVKTDELAKGGIALGMMPDITNLIKPVEVDLKKGDCIILYTDGVPECWRNEKETYGMPNFKRVVTQSCDLQSALAIKIALLADVKQWAGGYEQKDDITVMVLKKT